MRRFPNHAITKALVALIRTESEQQLTITDHVDDDVQLPYIVVGDINTSETDAKDEKISTSIVQIDIYSDYMGRQELDSIAEDITDILYDDDTVIDMAADGFRVIDGRIRSFETYEEAQYGYIGTITLEMVIQDLR